MIDRSSTRGAARPLGRAGQRDERSMRRVEYAMAIVAIAAAVLLAMR